MYEGKTHQVVCMQSKKKTHEAQKFIKEQMGIKNPQD